VRYRFDLVRGRHEYSGKKNGVWKKQSIDNHYPVLVAGVVFQREKNAKDF